LCDIIFLVHLKIELDFFFFVKTFKDRVFDSDVVSEQLIWLIRYSFQNPMTLLVQLHEMKIHIRGEYKSIIFWYYSDGINPLKNSFNQSKKCLCEKVFLVVLISCHDLEITLIFSCLLFKSFIFDYQKWICWISKTWNYTQHDNYISSDPLEIVAISDLMSLVAITIGDFIYFGPETRVSPQF
jgi:hypothetical protein